MSLGREDKIINFEPNKKTYIMAAKVNYSKLLDEIFPSLQQVSGLSYPKDTPLKHYMNIAKNLNLIEDEVKAFQATREGILKEVCDKDEEGNIIYITGENGGTEYSLTSEARVEFTNRYNELLETEVEIELLKLKSENFEGVAGLTPNALKGLMAILD